MSFARQTERFYMVRVLTPQGDAREVTSYGLRSLKHAARRARQMCDLLGRVPGRDDAGPLRTAWLDLVADGALPRLCKVEIVKPAPAGPDAPNGWKRVRTKRGNECVYEPAAVCRV